MANILSEVDVIDGNNISTRCTVENVAQNEILSLTPVLCWFSPPLVAISK